MSGGEQAARASGGPGFVVSPGGEASDADKAAKYRELLIPVLEQAGTIIGKAQRDGFKVGFSVSVDAFGKTLPPTVEIFRVL